MKAANPSDPLIQQARDLENKLISARPIASEMEVDTADADL
jgi:hypothetical protein